MSIALIDNFKISVKKPIDSRTSVANETERNSIPINYRWDGMPVFQIDERKTYTWNDVNQTWSSNVDFSIGTGIINSMTFWNTTNTLGTSFVFQRVINNSRGFIGVNVNLPKSEIQINSALGTGVPIYIASNSVNNTISDNWLDGGSIDSLNRGSSSFYFANGVVGISTRNPNSVGTMFDRFNINPTDVSVYGVHNINSMVVLDGTPNSFVKLSSTRSNIGNTNIGYVQEFARRSGSGGSSWLTYSIHNGISIDNSYLTPGTTRAFWERDPYNNFHHFGSSSNYSFTIDGGNNRIGVNTKVPTQSIDVMGNFVNGSGPIIKLENTNTVYPGSKPTHGSGMICKNINVPSPIFIGQMPLINDSDSSAFNVTLVNTGVNLLSINNVGQMKLGSISSKTSDKMVTTDENNEIFQQSIATMMSSDSYLVTIGKNGLMPKIDASLTPNGYYVLPGGLIIQWSRLTSGTKAYSFPMAFPNACFSIHITTDRTGSEDSGSRGFNHAKSVTRTSYYAIIDGNNGWMFAIGN
jgi:hypothetical protein